MLPPHNLLVDADGDRLFDSLSGAVYITNAASVEYISAVAELIAWLAQKALRLPLDVRTWSPGVPAVFIGQSLPESLPVVREGAELQFDTTSLLLVAATDRDLLVSAQRFNNWPLQATVQTLLENLSFNMLPEQVIRGLAFQNGGVSLYLTIELPCALEWSTLPSDLVEIRTPSARHTNPCNSSYQYEPQDQRNEKRFGLAQAFQGGGLFTGSRYTPENLLGRLSVEVPIKEALDLAARLSVEGLYSPSPLTGTLEDASVRLRIDAVSDAEVRIRDDDRGSLLEVVGDSAQTLAQATNYLAQSFPHLPDGTDLEGLEQGLKKFLGGETPFGRVGMVAALQEQNKIHALRALLPNPPSATSHLLGLPVTNTARDGDRTRWQQTFPWEGRKFLEELRSVSWQTGDDVVIEGFLSEAKSIRDALTRRIETLCNEQGVVAQIRLRSAYKPGLCWLLEDIGPRLTALGAVELRILCTEQKQGNGASDRWLRELYPVAEILEQRYGAQVSLDLTTSEETYQATAFDKDGNVVLDAYLTPPVLEAPLNGVPELGFVSSTTGQVTVYQGSALLLQKDLPTDRDLFWGWFTQTVIPTIRNTISPSNQGPYFNELSVVVSASEPDELLGLDHEHLSATESLHEDIYFGTLEALHHAAQLDTADRSFAPGRILPFCKVNQTGDTSALVTLRALGSYKLGLLDAESHFHEVQRYPFDVRVTSIRILADTSLHLELTMQLENSRAAHCCKLQLEWAAAQRERAGPWDPFLHQSDLTIRLQVAESPFDTIHISKSPRSSKIPELPDRQLLTREVVHHAKNLARRFPNVHLRALSESLCGEPLVALELLSVTSYSSRVRSAAWKPTVLISARQHANEPTSTNAMFAWLEEELDRGGMLERANIVFHPLENPDGARLHQALSQLSAQHMHHAARYTAVGADLQTNPISRGVVIPESQLRLDTWRRWRPELHLNCHGYPAHEWLRANGGYMPRHFEAWSLPFGYFTILTGGVQHEKLLQHLKSGIAEALTSRSHLQLLTTQQVQRALRYLRSSTFPFSLEKGFPFLSTLQTQEQNATSTDTFAPSVTVITEVPDETVSGNLWQWCIEAHRAIGETVVQLMYEHQSELTRSVRKTDIE